MKLSMTKPLNPEGQTWFKRMCFLVKGLQVTDSLRLYISASTLAALPEAVCASVFPLRLMRTGQASCHNTASGPCAQALLREVTLSDCPRDSAPSLRLPGSKGTLWREPLGPTQSIPDAAGNKDTPTVRATADVIPKCPHTLCFPLRVKVR